MTNGVVDQNLPLAFSVGRDDGQLSIPLLDVNKALDGITLSFHEINCTVGELARVKVSSKLQAHLPSFSRPTPSKQILFNVSGNFKPGMNAILGPTGCGKSTLLDILADRKDLHSFSGQVFVPRKLRSSSFKSLIGYVVQNDIINGTLTVRENLMFSANIRLSQSVPINERIDRVNQAIQDLHLEECADTRIGTDLVRGVSGGERKRACIGMELVLSPKILFLDEPTTGLDASTARDVMECLLHLSQQGCTIIFSIHQPRYSIFKLFDTILLLSQGHTIYFGPSVGLLPYFAAQGFICEEHDNPADFALDILIASHGNSFTMLCNAYLQSNMSLNNAGLPMDNRKENDILLLRTAARSRSKEFYYLAQRTVRNAIRNPELAASQIAVALIVAILIGLIHNQMEATVDAGVRNRLGAIFFIVVSQIFSTQTALEPFLKERLLFIHENISGYYHVSTFFVTKVVCDLVPMRVIPSVLFSLITFYMTGLQRSISRFFVFFITVFMANVFGATMCFFVAASIPIYAVALIVVVFGFVIMMMFSGFLVDLSSIFASLRWIQWLSGVRYASNILMINEFRNLKLCLSNNTSICPLTGEQVLSQREIDYTTDWDMWKNFLALSMMAIIFLVLTYIQLLRIKKQK